MNKTIIAIISIIVVVGGISYFTKNDSSPKITDSGTGVLEVVGNDFDFGEILMEGGLVRHNFVVRNVGDGAVMIRDVSTSCACTTAEIYNAKGEAQGPFGMVGPSHAPNPDADMSILPGEEMVVEAIYDPLKHGPDAVGKIVRDIYINTDTNKELSLKFRGENVKQFSKVDGPSLIFNNKEYDYGVLKQSQGIVETTFNVVNNGTETVIIDSLPTSCACTKATIDKKEIAVGDSAKITVAFDANLHSEPKGRFFKTIEIVSNVQPTPEIKIYVNMDYDMGIGKLKLQNHDGVDKHTKKADGHSGAGFDSVSSQELSVMLENRDFILIDVHTPEQQHIPGTDYVIPYDDVDKITAVIPSKNSKVFLYCRGGNMSKRVAKELVQMGYTNIFELDKGLNEWLAEGRDVLPKGSVN